MAKPDLEVLNIVFMHFLEFLEFFGIFHLHLHLVLHNLAIMT